MAVTLRNGSTVDDPRLDRLPSERTDHLDRFPLTAATLPEEPRPMLGASNWYSNFDEPVRISFRDAEGDRRTMWAIGEGDLGYVRGGHAYCLKPPNLVDPFAWWYFYDQGSEGRCVEFAKLRMMSLFNRQRYDITSHWHYWTDQMADEWRGGSYPGAYPFYEGTSGRAGMDGLLKRGVVPGQYRGATLTFEEAERIVRPDHGIAAYRWATSWDDVRAVTGTPDWMPGVQFLNSWGRGYPHITLILDKAGDRILREDGEFGVPTDR